MKRWSKIYFGTDGKFRKIPFVTPEPSPEVEEIVWNDLGFWNDLETW